MRPKNNNSHSNICYFFTLLLKKNEPEWTVLVLLTTYMIRNVVDGDPSSVEDAEELTGMLDWAQAAGKKTG